MRCISAVFAVVRCPSVCLSRSWITSKRINISSKFFDHRVATPFKFFQTKGGADIPTGTPLMGASNARGYDKMPIFSQISRCISETVILRWAHAARQFVSIEFSFHPYNILRDCPRGVPRGNKNVVKLAVFGLTHWLEHHITRKLLKIDGYMLQGVCQALNCLSIDATYCVIVAGASPGETKMWAAVHENGDFLHLQFE